jgi:hypothetical protein
MNKVLWFIFLTIIVLYIFFLYSKSNQIKETYTGTLRIANELDKKRAFKFALKSICQSKGYHWLEYGDEFSYDCKHSKQTCESESVFPTKIGTSPKYYEWRDSNSKDAKEISNRLSLVKDYQPQTLAQQAGQSSFSEESVNNPETGGICIIGNEMFRSMCEDEKLTYNKNDGTCVTNKPYCMSKCLPYCEKDCYVDPLQWTWEAIVGTTLGRGTGCAANLAKGELCALTQK